MGGVCGLCFGDENEADNDLEIVEELNVKKVASAEDRVENSDKSDASLTPVLSPSLNKKQERNEGMVVIVLGEWMGVIVCCVGRQYPLRLKEQKDNHVTWMRVVIVIMYPLRLSRQYLQKRRTKKVDVDAAVEMRKMQQNLRNIIRCWTIKRFYFPPRNCVEEKRAKDEKIF